MFSAKKRGGDLITEGMTLLTKATDSIAKGIQDNENDLVVISASIATLQDKSKDLTTENIKYSKIVSNFKKNILGEE